MPLGANPTGPSPSTGALLALGPDLSSWELWWAHNRDPYLELKRHLGSGVLTGSDEFFLGRGSVHRISSLRPSTGERAEVLPVLFEALRSERNGGVLSAALLALGKAGGAHPDSLEKIAPFLTHANTGVAEAATVALGLLGDARATALLTSMLECDVDELRERDQLEFGAHVPMRRRAFAAYSLALIGERSDPYHRTAVVHSLSRGLLGDVQHAVPDELRVACAVGLGLVRLEVEQHDSHELVPRPVSLMSRQQQVRFLLAALEDRRLDERSRAQLPISIARLLADTPPDFELRRIAGARFAELVQPRSEARSRELAQSSAMALGVLVDSDGDASDRSAREALAGAVEDGVDRETRRFAMVALARAAGRPGHGSGDALDGVAAARKALLTRLARGTQGDRCWAGLALGVLERALVDGRQPPSDDVRAGLRTALNEARSPSEVGALATALGIARDVSAGPLLRSKLAATHDLGARAHLAEALGMVGDTGSLQPLQKLLEDSGREPALMQAAAVGLVLLNDSSVVDRLIDSLDQARGLSTQAAAVGALAFAGDSRAVAPLERLAAGVECTDAARALAIAALASVVDDEDLPWRSRLSVDLNYLAGSPTLTDPASRSGLLEMP